MIFLNMGLIVKILIFAVLDYLDKGSRNDSNGAEDSQIKTGSQISL